MFFCWILCLPLSPQDRTLHARPRILTTPGKSEGMRLLAYVTLLLLGVHAQTADPDVNAPITQLVREAGFEISNRAVTTADNCSLMIFKVWRNTTSNTTRNTTSSKKAVLLVHGVLDSAVTCTENQLMFNRGAVTAVLPLLPSHDEGGLGHLSASSLGVALCYGVSIC